MGNHRIEFFYCHVRTNPRVKNFGPPFSKGSAVEGAEPSSPLARGETPFLALFFLIAFSFAPIWSKEKAAKEAENVRASKAFFP